MAQVNIVNVTSILPFTINGSVTTSLVDVIDVPYLDLENMEGMRKEAEQVRNLGFTGKGSIHPKQIKILNEVFTPPQDEILKAKKILEEFNNSNTGLVVIDGKLIEKPVLREMKRKILIADKINKV